MKDVEDWRTANRIARNLLNELESHNPSRKGHGDRVSVYAVACAYELGARDEDLYSLKFAAMLHDIGKLSISREILERNSAITEEERSAIRRSVLSGGEILAEEFEKRNFSFPLESRISREEFIRACKEILLHQYEGLPSDRAPLASRILHLCCAYDVMVTPQPWCKEKSEIEAIREIQNLSEKQFDPKVVEAFLKIRHLIQPIFPISWKP
ncbi:MAG TPA: HD domain-containing phosphohydrolase [Fimbriimonadales bacterium]|nr:HD domain-containing phosphohydrolase [Fimbriimonadales bacterium]